MIKSDFFYNSFLQIDFNELKITSKFILMNSTLPHVPSNSLSIKLEGTQAIIQQQWVKTLKEWIQKMKKNKQTWQSPSPPRYSLKTKHKPQSRLTILTVTSVQYFDKNVQKELKTNPTPKEEEENQVFLTNQTIQKLTPL